MPASLQAVIGRCLEKEPARRYQRAGEVRAALETVAAARTRSRRGGLTRSRRVRRSDRRDHRWPWRSRSPEPPSGGTVRRVGSNRSALPAAQIQSIAVLPLENLSGDPGEEYFVAGMHEALITDLARIGVQKVIAKASADAFKGTKKSLRDIGRELGVEGLVTGSVMRASDRIQITAQLVNADTGAVLWANRYERNAGDVLSLQNDVVGAIAREVRATLTPEQTARLATARPVNAAAHDAYLKGRSMFAAFTNSAFDLKQLDAVVAQFEHAIQIDPTYAPPYAAAERDYLTASSSQSASAEGHVSRRPGRPRCKAVQLDDTLADAHAALARGRSLVRLGLGRGRSRDSAGARN